MRRAASTPSMIGILTSINTTSTALSATNWTASAPLLQAPTQSMSPAAATNSAMVRCTNASSSTTKRRISLRVMTLPSSFLRGVADDR